MVMPAPEAHQIIKNIGLPKWVNIFRARDDDKYRHVGAAKRLDGLKQAQLTRIILSCSSCLTNALINWRAPASSTSNCSQVERNRSSSVKSLPASICCHRSDPVRLRL